MPRGYQDFLSDVGRSVRYEVSVLVYTRFASFVKLSKELQVQQ